MGAMKQLMLEQMEEELAEGACIRCGNKLEKYDVETESELCGYCRYVVEKTLED